MAEVHPGGPKTSKWTKAAQGQFTSFFGVRTDDSSAQESSSEAAAASGHGVSGSAEEMQPGAPDLAPTQPRTCPPASLAEAPVAEVEEQPTAATQTDSTGGGGDGGSGGSDGDDDGGGSEEEEAYYVTDIVDVMVERGRRLYRTECKGWVAGDDDTWEPVENLPAPLVAAFEKARAGDLEETDDEDER